MAYPNYPYPGYSPYYPQPVPDQLAQLRQQQMQQSMMQGPQVPMPPQPVPTPTGPQNSGIIWVSSKQEADGYLVAPSSAVALWDSNAPVIYLRQADSTGKPTTKVYDLVERTDAPPIQQQAPQIQLPDLSRYVTLDQLEDILTERLKRPAKAAQKKEDIENGQSTVQSA